MVNYMDFMKPVILYVSVSRRHHFHKEVVCRGLCVQQHRVKVEYMTHKQGAGEVEGFLSARFEEIK